MDLIFLHKLRYNYKYNLRTEDPIVERIEGWKEEDIARKISSMEFNRTKWTVEIFFNY